MSTKVTYAITFQLGGVLARLHAKKRSSFKKAVPAPEPLSAAVAKKLRQFELPKGLSKLQEFGELVAEYCIPGHTLDPHLLAGAIDGYTRSREFSAKELELLPQGVIFSIYKSAHRNNPRAKALVAAAARLEKSLE